MTTATSAASGAETRAQFNLRYLFSISLVAAMGGLLFGYDWVVIGGAKPFFEKYFLLTSEALSGWANSCAVVGCLIGSLTSGMLSDKYGRKRLLLAAAFLFAVSSVLTGWAGTFTWFVIWRIVGGVAIGLASNLSPMYIAEVAPAHLRGRMVAINQLTIVLGVLGAQVANWMIAEQIPPNATSEMIRESWNGQYGWRWMFTAVTLPSVAFFCGALWLPESPRWLVKSGQAVRARQFLVRIGGEAHAGAELREIEASVASEHHQRVGLAEIFAPNLRRVLLVGVILAVLQQWCGINVIFNYSEEIFRGAGYDVGSVLLNIVITGVVLVLFTLVAIWKVDALGRRLLMLVGCAGICVFHTMIGAAYHFELKGLVVMIPVLAVIACYSFSLAPITWVLISEIFPNRVRGAAVSIAVSALWIACFVLIYTFPLLNSALGPAGTFWLYAAICGAGFGYIFFRVPETKGKSLEQIERELSS